MQGDSYKPTWPTETNRGELPPRERFPYMSEAMLDCEKPFKLRIVGPSISGWLRAECIETGWHGVVEEDDLLTVSEWEEKYGAETE